VGLGVGRGDADTVPGRVQGFLAVAGLAEQGGPGALGVRVLRPPVQDLGRHGGRVAELSVVRERHGAYHQGVDLPRSGLDRAIGRDQRFDRLVRGQVDPRQRGQQGGIGWRGAQPGRDLTGRLVVSPQVGEEQGALAVLLRSGL
jgi:hypothetical protein